MTTNLRTLHNDAESILMHTTNKIDIIYTIQAPNNSRVNFEQVDNQLVQNEQVSVAKQHFQHL